MVIWQEITEKTKNKGTIYLSAKINYTQNRKEYWQEAQRFAGPYEYTGDIPHIYSGTIDSLGNIFITIATQDGDIIVFSSYDKGKSFNQKKIVSSGSKVIAPRIFATQNNQLYLFASQGTEESFTIVFASSQDGKNWSNFTQFAPSLNHLNPFQPYLISRGKRDYVVFQSLYNNGNRVSYQLYSCYTQDQGITWSESFLVTNQEASVKGQTFHNFHNQRPFLFEKENHLYLAWERMYFSSENAHIYFAELDNDGKIMGTMEKVSESNSNQSYPVIFDYQDIVSVVWFDMRRGYEGVYFAQKRGYFWEETVLSTTGRKSSFGMPFISGFGDFLTIYWQEKQKNTTRLVELAPDQHVNPPTIKGKNLVPGKRYNKERVQFTINFPEDSSGIAGFSALWTQDNTQEPDSLLALLPEDAKQTFFAAEDGYWYLKVKICDYAGNWSETKTFSYFKDTTPPEKPHIQYPQTNLGGFLVSNTFSIQWSMADKTDIAGYTYTLQLLESDTKKNQKNRHLYEDFNYVKKLVHLPKKLVTKKESTSFDNVENGLYAFSVAAIDSVGNIGESATVLLELNKYKPYTLITALLPKTDELGNTNLSIIGKGFTYDGKITTIFIDKDKQAPYDKVLSLKNNEYILRNDKNISNIMLQDLEEGNYYIGLNHSVRGLYFSKNKITIKEYGTVKIGDYSFNYQPDWILTETHKGIKFPISRLLPLILALFACAGLILSIKGLIAATQDGIIIKKQLHALMTGDIMPNEKKHKVKELQHKGLSLKVKLMFFTLSLITMIIVFISFPLSYIMTTNQEETLAKGLQDRVTVLLESLSSSVKAYLPSQNILELGFLPQQIQALSEAQYATITGFSSQQNTTHINHLWATNDPAIQEKINTKEVTFGISQVSTEEITSISDYCLNLNAVAQEKVSALAQEITSLTREGISLALKNDTKSIERRNEIQDITRQLTENLNTELQNISLEGSGSYPEYNSQAFARDNTTYLFYKPVLYRQGSDQNFVRGIVFIEVKTDELIQQLDSMKKDILKTVGIIALLALGFGVILSLIISSIIVSPIKKLAQHVAMIRDTSDKEQLEGKDIILKSKDEIGLLGETVNDMSHGLIKAAAASKDLTVGKEVQKMFIPLETDSAGKKLTTGKNEDNNAQFFGYYEGAKGVSGDYFDYLKLDDRYFAIIKCDVAGKGVPAALIMVEVATLFLNYFRDWSFKKNGTNLGPIVSQINDLIESRGFKGRFAAFTLCIFDSKTGDLHFCNAGDNLIHIYDASEKKKKTITLPETPASGVFPSFMVDMKGGFNVQKLHLDKDDVLFLYTDGIEEAKRLFRDKNYKPIICEEPGLEKESPHGYHTVGQESEEMAPERVNAIIEAVFNKTSFQLQKYHCPEENDKLIFDFSTCEGTAEEAILALVSVEKIFRMYKDPKATQFDVVQVDKKIDSFLNEHFKQYNDYCGNKKPHPEFNEYLYYTHVKEDDQYDDLTLMAIKKK